MTGSPARAAPVSAGEARPAAGKAAPAAADAGLGADGRQEGAAAGIPAPQPVRDAQGGTPNKG